MTFNSAPFSGALVSGGPNADLPPHQQIFAPFIGGWELLVTWYEDGGTIKRQEHGEWHFAWVLEGRAIQDVWIVPPRSERAGHQDLYEYGTSLRFFDRALGAWRSTWIGPAQHAVHTFTARRIADEVVLVTTLDSRRGMRWVFSDIEENSFTWRNSRETDGGWILTQDFQARRIRPCQ